MPGHVSNVIRLNVGEALPIAMPQRLASTHNQMWRLAMRRIFVGKTTVTVSKRPCHGLDVDHLQGRVSCTLL